MDPIGTRKEYGAGDPGDGPVDPAAFDPDPLRQFEVWFATALGAGLVEPHAMALATADRNGRPSVRMVLLKRFAADGFVFCTNYESQKGLELAENPAASLLFFWDRLERQVRISGGVARTSDLESTAHWNARPRASRIGALASAQSRSVSSRDQLLAAVASLELRHPGEEVPRPETWGGYRVTPTEYEFWQGRRDRLHDRVRYRLEGGVWARERLAP